MAGCPCCRFSCDLLIQGCFGCRFSGYFRSYLLLCREPFSLFGCHILIQDLLVCRKFGRDLLVCDLLFDCEPGRNLLIQSGFICCRYCRQAGSKFSCDLLGCNCLVSCELGRDLLF